MRSAFAVVCLGLALLAGAALADPPTIEAPLGPVGGPAAPVVAAAPSPLSCLPQAKQGGAILCHAEAGARLALDGAVAAVADNDGLAVIGLKRNQPSPATITLADPLDVAVPFARRAASALVEVAQRHDPVSKLSMDCNKIAAQSPEEKRKAEISWEKKEAALRIFSTPLAPFEMVKPVDGAYSSSFGATRTYVPKTKDCKATTNVHNGTDIAVPTGTEIRAPMAGTVILADPDLYYEGGCVFLDIGRGLVSVTMHMSRIDVKPGQVVKQGELLGLSGATGRVTGPHVHWAIKYRNPTDADRASDIWLDPTILLGLNSNALTAP